MIIEEKNHLVYLEGMVFCEDDLKKFEKSIYNIIVHEL